MHPVKVVFARNDIIKKKKPPLGGFYKLFFFQKNLFLACAKAAGVTRI